MAENCAATADVIVVGMVKVTARIRYFQQHLDALGRALERGARVAGYFHWSLPDSFGSGAPASC
jgi:beta-glucosidase